MPEESSRGARIGILKLGGEKEQSSKIHVHVYYMYITVPTCKYSCVCIPLFHPLHAVTKKTPTFPVLDVVQPFHIRLKSWGT